MIRLIVVIFTAVISGIIDVLIKKEIIPLQSLINFSQFKISLNVFELIIIGALIYLLMLLFENKGGQLLFSFIKKYRARSLKNYWGQFKAILLEYKETHDENLSEKYVEVRKKLDENYQLFSKELHENPFYTSSGNDLERHRTVLQELEFTFSPKQLREWTERVKRSIPRELDCYDFIFIRLEKNI